MSMSPRIGNRNVTEDGGRREAVRNFAVPRPRRTERDQHCLLFRPETGTYSSRIA
jgi:hypothetical protein